LTYGRCFTCFRRRFVLVLPIVAAFLSSQTTIEEQAETIRLQSISIEALKRQTELIGSQTPPRSLSAVEVGTVLFYRRVVGAEIERVEVRQSHAVVH
jgi:hypothetical protein